MLSIKTYRNIENLKNKIENRWYKLMKPLAKLLEKIENKNIEKYKNPKNHNKKKLLKLIKKEIIKIIYRRGKVELLDIRDTYINNDSCDFYIPYKIMEQINNRCMINYRLYAYKKDKETDWTQEIIKILQNECNVECFKYKGLIDRPWDYTYQKYKDENVFIIKERK